MPGALGFQASLSDFQAMACHGMSGPKDFENMTRAAGLQLPLMLHDGESDWSTSNTVDAVLLGAKRCLSLDRSDHVHTVNIV